MALTLSASDGHSVDVAFNEPQAAASRFVEVTGQVQPDGSLSGYTTTNLGDDFDLANYNEAVLLMKRFPAPFGGAPGV